MEKQLNELQAMFPSLEMGIIALMLRECNNDVTSTVEKLLILSDGDIQTSSTRNRSTEPEDFPSLPAVNRPSYASTISHKHGVNGSVNPITNTRQTSNQPDAGGTWMTAPKSKSSQRRANLKGQGAHNKRSDNGSSGGGTTNPGQGRPQSVQKRFKSGEYPNAHLRPSHPSYQQHPPHRQQQQQQQQHHPDDFTDPNASLLPQYYNPHQGQPYYDDQGQLYYVPANYPGYYYSGMQEPESLFTGEQLDWTRGDYFQTEYGMENMQRYPPQLLSEMTASSSGPSSHRGGEGGREQWPTKAPPLPPPPAPRPQFSAPLREDQRGPVDLDEVSDPSSMPPATSAAGGGRFGMGKGGGATEGRRLIILRGAPGSGKTTLARKLVGDVGVICSTDSYFIVNGEYVYDSALLGEYHDKNKRKAANAMKKGRSPVIIDNTNSSQWEMKPYVVMGRDFGYNVEILEPDTPWKYNVAELARRTRHKVPRQTIERLLERQNAEPNVTIESILGCVQPEKKDFQTANKERSSKHEHLSNGTRYYNHKDPNPEPPVDSSQPSKPSEQPSQNQRNSRGGGNSRTQGGQSSRPSRSDNYRQSNHRDKASPASLKRPSGPKQTHPRRSHPSAPSPAQRKKDKTSHNLTQGNAKSSTNSKPNETHSETSPVDAALVNEQYHTVVHPPIDTAAVNNVSATGSSNVASTQQPPKLEPVAEQSVTSTLSSDWLPSTTAAVEWSVAKGAHDGMDWSLTEKQTSASTSSKPAATPHITSEVWSSFDVSDVKIDQPKVAAEVDQLDVWKKEFQTMTELHSPSTEEFSTPIAPSPLQAPNEQLPAVSSPSINPPLMAQEALELYPRDSNVLFPHGDSHGLMVEQEEHQAFTGLSSGGVSSTSLRWALDSALAESLASETASRRRVLVTPDRDYSDPQTVQSTTAISEKASSLAPTSEVLPSVLVSKPWEDSVPLSSETLEAELSSSSSSASVEEIFDDYNAPESPSLISQSLEQALIQADPATMEQLHPLSPVGDLLPPVEESSDGMKPQLANEPFAEHIEVIASSEPFVVTSEENQSTVVSSVEVDLQDSTIYEQSESPFEGSTLQECLSDESNSAQYVFPSAYVSENPVFAEAPEEPLSATLSPELEDKGGSLSTPQASSPVSPASLDEDNDSHLKTADKVPLEAERNTRNGTEPESAQIENGAGIESTQFESGAENEFDHGTDSEGSSQLWKETEPTDSVGSEVHPLNEPSAAEMVVTDLNPDKIDSENESIEALDKELSELDDKTLGDFCTEGDDISNDLIFLIECFPDLDPSYLQHLYLQSCGSNVEEAVSCALLTATDPNTPDKESYFAFPFNKESSPSADETSDTLSSSCEANSASRSFTTTEDSFSDTAASGAEAATRPSLKLPDQNATADLNFNLDKIEGEAIFDCMSDNEIARALQEELDREAAETKDYGDVTAVETAATTDPKRDAESKSSTPAPQEQDSARVAGSMASESEATCDEDNLVLKLTPSLARQLQAMFGPVYDQLPFEGNMREKDLEVLLSERAAKEIYQKWLDTLEARRIELRMHSEMLIQKDEAYARDLQAGEQYNQRKAKRKNRNFSASVPREESRAGKRSSRLAVHEGGVKRLSEIIDEQLAQDLSDQEITDLLHSQCSSNLSLKLQLNQLHSRFPQVDRMTIDRALVQNRYNHKAAAAQLQGLYSTEGVDGNASSQVSRKAQKDGASDSRNVGPGKPRTPKKRTTASGGRGGLLRKSPSKISVRKIPQDDQSPQQALEALEDLPSYNNLRAEAALHAKLRAENFQKAAHARSKKQWELATYYAQQGHMHTDRMKEANTRAAGFILTLNEGMSDTLDMHGLHVSEALEALREKIAGAQPGKSVHVITGRGSHSKGREARIKPAVLQFLRQNGYRFEETNAGMLKVTAR